MHTRRLLLEQRLDQVLEVEVADGRCRPHGRRQARGPRIGVEMPEDVAVLREPGDQVGDAVADPDRRRVKGDVEGEPARAGEGRRVAARNAVLFEDEDLETLAGERGRAAKPAQTRADDPDLFLAHNLL